MTELKARFDKNYRFYLPNDPLEYEIKDIKLSRNHEFIYTLIDHMSGHERYCSEEVLFGYNKTSEHLYYYNIISYNKEPYIILDEILDKEDGLVISKLTIKNLLTNKVYTIKYNELFVETTELLWTVEIYETNKKRHIHISNLKIEHKPGDNVFYMNTAFTISKIYMNYLNGNIYFLLYNDTVKIFKHIDDIKVNFNITKIKSFKRDYNFLSMYYLCPIKIGTTTYPSLCNYYYAMRAKELIYHTYFTKTTPAQARRIGNVIEPYAKFELEKKQMLRLGLQIKFSNPELRKKLLDTKESYLINDDETDLYLGYDKTTHMGENMLGKLLMEIRTELGNR